MNLLDAGIQLIVFLQSLGSWLTTPMQMLSFLGTEEFFLFAAPAIYWCFSPQAGMRLGLLLMTSGILNAALKLVFHAPRPYWYSTEVQALSAETSFGIPSGHAQHAVVVWGGLAASLGKGWTWVLGLLLAFFIGVSRLYLGMHFPTDVLFGWVVGAALLWTALRLEGPIVRRLLARDLGDQILIALGASLALALIGAGIRLSLGAYTVPGAWTLLAQQALPEAEPIAPLALSGLISHAGTFFGLAAGGLILHHRGGFSAAGPAWQRLARFLIGVVGVAALWFGLGAIFPRGEYLISYLLRYARYALVGIWVSGLAPWLFIRLGLAQPEQKRVSPAATAI